MPTINNKPCPKCNSENIHEMQGERVTPESREWDGATYLHCFDCNYNVLLGETGHIDYDVWNINDPYRKLTDTTAKLEAVVAHLNKVVFRFEHCAEMIDGGFNIVETLRLQHAAKARAYANEAREALQAAVKAAGGAK